MKKKTEDKTRTRIVVIVVVVVNGSGSSDDDDVEHFFSLSFQRSTQGKYRQCKSKEKKIDISLIGLRRRKKEEEEGGTFRFRPSKTDSYIYI